MNDNTNAQLYNAFIRLMSEYSSVYEYVTANNDWKNSFRDIVAKEIPELLCSSADISDPYTVVGSYGKGRWTAVPWIAVFDTRITSSAQKGVYIVYLLNKDTQEMFLTFEIAATEAMGTRTNADGNVAFVGVVGNKSTELKEKLQKKADQIRQAIKDDYFNKDEKIDSGATGYDSGAVYYKKYSLNSLPSGDVLVQDLKRMMNIYKMYYDWTNTREISDDETVEPVEESEEAVPTKSTKDAINQIKEYIEFKGFSYDDSLIDNFYLSLKSKPFVILAGISGTGKSKIAQLFAEAIGADFAMVSVKPDWSDSTDLLGYVGLDGKFNPGRLTLKLKEANENPDKSYIICLDEMNLARVEYYFSDFLSVIETMRDVDGKYRSENIFTESDFKGDETAKDDYGEIHISSNVYVVGTVNMDETTFPFSKKVLDRANTIEFSEVSLGIDESIPDETDAMELKNEFLQKEFKSFRETYIADDGAYKEDIKKVIKVLESINGCLDEIGAQVAYRVRDEIAFYMATARKYELMEAEEVLDLAIMQKILPRVQGSSGNIRNALVKMAALLLQDSSLESSDPTSEDIKNKIGDKYPRSLNKIAFMLRRYELDGYTSYWI